MQTPRDDNPRLRLVGADVSAQPIRPAGARHASPLRAAPKMRDASQSERAVAREMRSAAANQPALDPTDPRWVVAARAYSQLEGSTMTPERRARVLDSARKLGVQPFEANLIIALVQDQRRRGRTLHDAAPALRLIPQNDRSSARPSQSSILGLWIAAAAAAAVFAWLMIRWLLSA